MTSRWLWKVAVLCLLALAGPVVAQPRAWLDRDTISANESVTLNIQSEGIARPDYDPLLRDFSISGRSSRNEMDSRGVHSLFAVALRPRRDGRLTIPALNVGGQRTQPLVLTVRPSAAPPPSHAGDDVFLESEADSASPYVQQAVGWVVRLYTAAPLISGQLDQPAPEGASLQQIGEDARYTREIAGRRYEVIERRYQLIPERSGTIAVPGARFEGRGTGGFFDEVFGGRGAALSAQAAPRILNVRPAPAAATQPWLPLHELKLRYVTTPRDLRAGQAATLTIEVTADGATSAQMPELQLPPIAGVQVFPDPAQADDLFREGRPRVKLTRRFALVPTRPGPVTLQPLQMSWWDVTAGASRTTQLQPLTWHVAAADPAAAPVPPSATGPRSIAVNTNTATDVGSNRLWILTAALFAGLWLVTLVWALHHRQHAGHAAPAVARETRPAVATASTLPLKQALDTGDLGDVALALCALARPGVRDLHELDARLADPVQRDAVAALQKARWGGGDGVEARRQLRAAFAQGPNWRETPQPARSALPPLYPPE